MRNLKALRKLFVANTVSGVAQGISMIAIPWHFAQLEGGNPFGRIYLLFTCCAVFWTLFAGMMVDRYSRKSVFLVMDVICFLVLFGISAYGFYYQELSVWMVSLVFGITFLGYNLHYPSLYAFVQEVAEPSQYSKLSSWIEIQAQGSAALAGGAAALLLDSDWIANFLGFDVELWHVFLLDGCTYLLAFFLILNIKYTPIAKRKFETESYIQRLQVGVKYLKKHPYIFQFGALGYSTFISILVLSYFLLPEYIDNVLEAPVWTLATHELLFASGAVLSAVLANKWFDKKPVVGMVFFLSLVAIFYFLVGIIFNLWLFLLTSLVMGIGNSGARILRASLIFRTVPNQVIGRISSVFHQYHTFIRISFIGLFSYPFFVQDRNVVFAFIIMGGFILTNALILIGIRKKMLAVAHHG